MDTPLELKNLTKALASGFTQVRLAVSRLLTGLYIVGDPSPEEYGQLVYTGNIRKKIPQAYGEELDKLGYMFSVKRRFFERDENYRARILFAVRVSTTRTGLTETVKFILEGTAFYKDARFAIEVRESINDYFDGYTSAINSPVRQQSMIGGVTVYINPVTMVKYIKDYKEVTTTYDSFLDTFKGKLLPPFYKFAKNIDYNRLLESGEYKTFRDMVETIVAAGINVDRVVLQQPGASGNRGEYYAYEL